MSRFCDRSLVPDKEESTETFWSRVLITDMDPGLKGHIIIACNDEAIQFVATNEASLRDNFILENNPGPIRLTLLDKQQSIEIAQRAGLEVPRQMTVRTRADVEEAMQSWQLPVLVRPFVSHEFTRVFNRKLVLCQTRGEIQQTAGKALDAGVAVMLCEYVPGDDDLLCSYYTYMDDLGRPLFKFTKRVLRRNPYNFGEGSYHITEWLPDVAATGQEFFDAAGLRGLGNIEFKRDPRDGKLKFIECNARFTAAHELFVQSRFDIGLFVYGQLAGLPYELPSGYEDGVSMSVAMRDFRAFRNHPNRNLSFIEWLGQTFFAQARPYFQWSDPLPLVGRTGAGLREVRRKLGFQGQSAAN